jgi:hypothetical protein
MKFKQIKLFFEMKMMFFDSLPNFFTFTYLVVFRQQSSFYFKRIFNTDIFEYVNLS